MSSDGKDGTLRMNHVKLTAHLLSNILGMHEDPSGKNEESALSDNERIDLEHKTVKTLLKPLMFSFHPDTSKLPQISAEKKEGLEKFTETVDALRVLNALWDAGIDEKLRLRRWPAKFDFTPNVTNILYYGRSRTGEVRGPTMGILPGTPNAFFTTIQEFLKSGSVPQIIESAASNDAHPLEGPILDATTFDDIANLRNQVANLQPRIRDRLLDLLTESLAVIVKKKGDQMDNLADLQNLRDGTFVFLKSRGQGLMYTDPIYYIEQRAKHVGEEMLERAKTISEVENALDRINTYTFSAPSVYKDPLFEIAEEKISASIIRSMRATTTESGYQTLKEKIRAIKFIEGGDQKIQRLVHVVEKHQKIYPDYKNKVLRP
jgi:hypothetical protein